jgi:arylsulfatase A-like enzyme
MAGKLTISDREWDIVKAWYDACILHIDRLIGRMIDLLSDQGLLETTLLIITADHGENFGEHGLADHVYCVYDTLLHVPLIMAGPEDLVPQRQQIKHLVSLVDIFPSVIHLIDSGNPLAKELPGKSILPLHGYPIRDQVFAEYGPPFSFGIFERLHPDFSPERFDRAFKTVRTTSHKYILASDGSRELYDLTTDPGETENKVTQFPQLSARLHQQLTDTLGPCGEQSCSEPTDGLSIEEDKTLVEHLRKLGYL